MRIGRVGQANNFDFLRLALAILVIASHSYALGVGSEVREPLRLWTRGQMTFGALAVDGFFIMSGLLIASSAERSLSMKEFFRKRVARIYPAFIVCAILTVLLVKPLAGAGLTAGTPLSRIVDVVQQTLRLREFHYTHAFAVNPFPGEMNGSIWSIQYEFWCYIGVALLVSAGLLRLRLLVLILFLALVLVGVLAQVQDWQPHGGWMISLLGLPQFWARLAPLYLAGVVFYLYRDRIRLRLTGACVAVVALVLACFWSYGWSAVFPFAGTYLIFYLAYVPQSRLQQFGRFGDLSYGTYLYAFPVQQLLVHAAGHSMAPWLLFVTATPLTLVLAAGSWYGVERRFLGAGRRKETPVHAVEKEAHASEKVLRPMPSK